MRRNRVLLIDDDPDLTESLFRALRGSIEADWYFAKTPEEAREAFREEPDVMVLDLSLERSTGVESGFSVLRDGVLTLPASRIIVLTGHGDTAHGVRALSLGAAHFIAKPADPSHIAVLIRDGLQQAFLRRQVRELSQERESSLSTLLRGQSEAIRHVREKVLHAAQTTQPVLITGETGTGKGVCAHAVHLFGDRRSARFVRYQPRFGPGDLTSSELFGHKKGAYTGAIEDRKGVLAEADRGTLFLDEIDELPSETQVALLGVLQEKRFRAVGSNEDRRMDARILAATNRDLEECLEAGKLRRDLYHRLAHYRIHIPPLRERKEDIRILAEGLLEVVAAREALRVTHLEADAIRSLEHREWPGNVRELEAAIESAAWSASIRGRTFVVLEDLEAHGNSPSDDAGSFHTEVERFKRKLIRDALRSCGGNQVQASKLLGINRSVLRRLID